MGKQQNLQQKTVIQSQDKSLRAYSLEGILSTAQGLPEYIIFTATVDGTATLELDNPFPVFIESVQAASASGQISITSSEGLPIVPNQSSVEMVNHPEIVLPTSSSLNITTSEETSIRITAKRVALF